MCGGASWVLVRLVRLVRLVGVVARVRRVCSGLLACPAASADHLPVTVFVASPLTPTKPGPHRSGPEREPEHILVTIERSLNRGLLWVCC